jgi:autotransporter-associated beta strand protein
MFRTWYRQWINRMNWARSGRVSTATGRKPRQPPRLEPLEDRLAPATHQWTGSLNNLWSNPGNWFGGAPAPNETNLILVFGIGASNPSNVNDILGLSAKQIVFQSGGFTLNGNSLRLAGNTTVDNRQPVTGSTNTINLGLNLGVGSSSAHDHLFLMSNNVLDLRGRLTGPALNTLHIFGQGGGDAGSLRLSNSTNNYGGTTLVEGGGAVLRLGAANAVPARSTLTVNPFATFDLAGLDDTIGSLSGAANGRVILGNGTLTTGGDNSSTTFAGDLIGGGIGVLVKAGNGTMTLSGNVNNLLVANITGGTLLVNSSVPNLALNVGSPPGPGTLSGFGTIGSAAVGNSPAGGTLSPGTSSTTGILHSTGVVTFNSAGTFRVRLNGTTAGSGYDQLSAGSQVSLTTQPTLSVSLGFAAAIGDTFTIITSASSVTGQFKGLPDGAGLTVGGARFQIHYTVKQVILTRVPGPATQYLISAPSHSEAGVPFSVTVTALDPDGNIVNTYAGTVHFTTSDPSGGSLPADYTFTQADEGVHTFADGATLFTTGSQTITVTDAITGIDGSVTVLVTPAPAASFAIDAPASAASGSPVDITVTAQDPYGNTDTNYQGTVTFSSSDTDPNVVLPADYTFQAADMGSATFAGGVTLITTGDQTVTATDTVSGITGSATITVTTAPAGSGPGNQPGGPDTQAPLVVATTPEAAAPRLTETIRSAQSGTEKTVPLPLDGAAVDRLFATTPQDARNQAGLRTHDNALAGANDGLWDWVSNDDVVAV